MYVSTAINLNGNTVQYAIYFQLLSYFWGAYMSYLTQLESGTVNKIKC